MSGARIFLSGYSGAGKTTTANYLQTDHGWIHIDMEWIHRNRGPLFGSISRSPAKFLQRYDEDADLVVSWGYVLRYAPIARQFVEAGLTPVYFHGPIHLTHRNILRRGDPRVPLEAGSEPTGRSKNQITGWYDVNVFRSDERMRTVDELAREVIRIAHGRKNDEAQRGMR